MDYKNMFSALLGFSTVIFLNLPAASSTFTRNGDNVYVPLFIIVLVSQIILEILAKYQGKLCETIEGLFTALIAVLGYALYMAVSHGNILSSTTSSQQYNYSQQGGGQKGGAVLDMPQALMAGVVVAIFLFIWKKWLKPKLGITFAMCPSEASTQTTVQTIQTVQQQPQQQQQQPQQQQHQPVQQVQQQPMQQDAFMSY